MCEILKKNFVSVLVGLICISLCWCSKKRLQNPGDVNIQAVITANQHLKVKLELAPDTHVYLDRGAEGNLIPISFDWEDLMQSNGTTLTKKPQLVSSPQGEYDKKTKAKVLRGQGEYLFSVKQANTLKGAKFRLKTQVCDEVVGICYRPKWTETTIGTGE